MADPRTTSVAEVGRRLGVSENRLRERKKAVLAKRADAVPGSGPLTPVAEGHRRLRAEVKRRKMGRDTLKKMRRRSSPPGGVICA